MRSKTSFFNKTLFCKDLTRFWPLWGLASFLGALCPLSLLSELLRGGMQGAAALEMTWMYYTVLQGGVPVVSLLYGLLCAMAVWCYLYDPRSVGMMHALPIRREGLFATSFLAGMTMLLIPYAVTGLLCVAVTAPFGLFEPVGLLVTVLGVLGESFFYFSTATAVAFVTGNVFAMPALYLLLHFLEAILDRLFSHLASNAVFGLTASYSGALEFLSPTVYLFRRVSADCQYVEVEEYYGTTTMKLSAVHLNGGWLIFVYALLGAALLAVAFALYRRRRSERAKDVVAVGWMRPVFRYGIAALAALAGGQLLYGIFVGSGGHMAAMALCMLVAGTIGYYAASMLLARTLRVFRGSLRGLALVALGVAALCGGLRFDVLGLERRMPALGDLKSVYFSVAGNDYELAAGRDDETIRQLQALHEAVVADRDYIRSCYQDDGRSVMTTDRILDSDWGTANLRISYRTRAGYTVDRFYRLPMNRQRVAQPGTYDQLLDAFVNGPALRARRLHLDDGYQVSGGSLYVSVQEMGYDLSDREAGAILSAVGRDAETGAWGTYSWFGDDEDKDLALDLELRFETPDGEDRGPQYRWITIRVRPGMSETVRCLLELELVTEKDLITNEEFYNGRVGKDFSLPASAEISAEVLA